MSTYWHKQTKENPLFPDLLWSRPENKLHAGKLLIIGGNLHGFNAPANAVTEAERAGVGAVRVFLPDALRKTVSKLFPETEYAPSTPSGSFAKNALAELLDAAHWSDGVLLAGNLGRNSETSILLESFLQKYPRQVTLVGDSIDYFLSEPLPLIYRTDTALVIDFAQLQKLLTGAKFDRALTSDLGIAQIVDILHHFSADCAATLVLVHNGTTYVATRSNVSTTSSGSHLIKAAAYTSTWWLQNPSKPFEAISTAIAQ